MTQTRPFRAAILVLALAVGWAAPARAAEYRLTTQRVLADPLSGIALYGYDPVAYFVDGAARPGAQAFELDWGGATWRFASQANREEFLRSPETFAPAYGGYDADSVARGFAVASDPTVYKVEDDRLFLFRSEEARVRFAQEGGAAAADKAWPQVLKEIGP
ncbi:YHS domain-containing (seleno)protein [Alsobacter sp. KACC 23698]|uniref:YHS domain-containing (Seleno)protein n=1 Tax=Alsobacter sp. KACC 23698 TaxID=3149229 RepID=A0AAU7JBR1_9HYPH